MHYFYVAIFGAFGAVTRYWIVSSIGADAFPYSTLLINITGCFLLAIVVRYLTTFPNISKNVVTGIGTGFLGSFTTFSAFSTEICVMIDRGDGFTAACYIFASVMGGFLSAALGFLVSDWLIRRKGLSENGD